MGENLGYMFICGSLLFLTQRYSGKTGARFDGAIGFAKALA